MGFENAFYSGTRATPGHSFQRCAAYSFTRDLAHSQHDIKPACTSAAWRARIVRFKCHMARGGGGRYYVVNKAVTRSDVHGIIS